MTSVPSVLITVPVRVHDDEQLDSLLRCLVSLAGTAPDAPVLVVDDRSPTPLATLIERATLELGQAYVRQEDGQGAAAAINVGLGVAAANGADAILVGPDVELRTVGWIETLRARTDVAGRLAAVVGGAVTYANGGMKHAGYYFSMLQRRWGTRLHHAPDDLPAVRRPCQCPVSSSLQLVRHACIEAVGFYDEQFEHDSGDIDYCLRVFAAGLESVLEPSVRARSTQPAIHGAIRIDGPQREDLMCLRKKHLATDMSRWTPEAL